MKFDLEAQSNSLPQNVLSRTFPQKLKSAKDFVCAVAPNVVRHAPGLIVDSMDLAWGAFPDYLKGIAVVGAAHYASSGGVKRKAPYYSGADEFESAKRQDVSIKEPFGNLMPIRKAWKRKRSVRFKRGKRKRKRSRSRRKFKKRRRSRSRKLVTKRGVKAMIARTNNESIIQNYREYNTGSISSPQNACYYWQHEHLKASAINLIIDKTLPTLTSIGGKTFHKLDITDNNITIKSKGGTSTYNFVNNYGFNVLLTFWICDPKTNIGISPVSAFEEGLDGLVTDGAEVAITDAEDKLLYYPSDSKVFKMNYKIIKKSKVLLKPGEMCKVVVPLRKGIFRPTDHAVNATAYKKSITRFLMVRQEGTLGHDETAEFTEVGPTDTRVEWSCSMNWNYVVKTSLQTAHSELQFNTDTMAAGAEQIQQDVEMVDIPEQAG